MSKVVRSREAYPNPKKEATMRRIFAFLVVIAIGVAVLGYYRGWFTVSSSSGDHEAGVNVTIDKDKLKEDKEKAKQQIKEKTKGLSDKANKEPADNP